ncbi:hypothetical protein BST61_g9756 [Cercospora zeina]
MQGQGLVTPVAPAPRSLGQGSHWIEISRPVPIFFFLAGAALPWRSEDRRFPTAPQISAFVAAIRRRSSHHT